jgi:hypothetical protein
MCDSHIRGSQYDAWIEVNAHFTPLHVRPFATKGFSLTYCGSSKSTNP